MFIGILVSKGLQILKQKFVDCEDKKMEEEQRTEKNQ